MKSFKQISITIIISIYSLAIWKSVIKLPMGKKDKSSLSSNDMLNSVNLFPFIPKYLMQAIFMPTQLGNLLPTFLNIAGELHVVSVSRNFYILYVFPESSTTVKEKKKNNPGNWWVNRAVPQNCQATICTQEIGWVG